LHLLQGSLTPQRRHHSLRVASLAMDLCLRYGINPDRGEVAGLAHDLAREMEFDAALALASQDGFPISRLERRNPVLLHGRAAAVLIRESLGIEDQEILEAVSAHVTGRPSMGLLAKIVFVADFLEPGRDFIDMQQREHALTLDLDGMTALVLEHIFAYLREAGKPIAEPARMLYQELRRQ
jgi:predicted HD superfamily hydrolase involved in NAD metabolism